MSKTFDYTKASQNFTVLVEGSYTFELTGATGGTLYDNKHYAPGGKSAGTITNLPKNTTLYVYVGGKGGDGSKTADTGGFGGAGGWNGGGKGGAGEYSGSKLWAGGGGGGGATDIRFVQGDSTDSLKTRIIVAGGGGGWGGNSSSTTTGAGGAGGGAAGGPGLDITGKITVAAGATQNSGNAFGQGADGGNGSNKDSSAEGHGGGGGGYYGGKAKEMVDATQALAGGSGGSGFVYGLKDTDGDANYPVPTEYTNYKFTNGSSTIGASNVSSSYNGSAKVTYTPIP
jgi:hypothetical protein